MSLIGMDPNDDRLECTKSEWHRSVAGPARTFTNPFDKSDLIGTDYNLKDNLIIYFRNNQTFYHQLTPSNEFMSKYIWAFHFGNILREPSRGVEENNILIFQFMIMAAEWGRYVWYYAHSLYNQIPRLSLNVQLKSLIELSDDETLIWIFVFIQILCSITARHLTPARIYCVDPRKTKRTNTLWGPIRLFLVFFLIILLTYLNISNWVFKINKNFGLGVRVCESVLLCERVNIWFIDFIVLKLNIIIIIGAQWDSCKPMMRKKFLNYYFLVTKKT